MTGTGLDERLVRALCGHYRVLEQTHGLGPADGVRLAAALLAERLEVARAAGLDEASLEALRGEGAQEAAQPGLEEAAALDAAPLQPVADQPVPLDPAALEPVEPEAEAAAPAAKVSGAAVLVIEDAPPAPAASTSGAAVLVSEAPVPLDPSALVPVEEAPEEVQPAVEEQEAETAHAEEEAVRAELEARRAEEAAALAELEAAQAEEEAARAELEAARAEEEAARAAEALEDELAPAPQETGDAAIDEGTVRRHPRFVARNEVLVTSAGRDDLKALWTRDISSGGLFVNTDDPPPRGTMLSISLKTPDGTLELHGEVVHVLDAAAAKAAGIDPGVGVQFTDLTDRRRQALEQYVQGLAKKLEAEAAAEAATAGEDVLKQARSFLRYVESSNVYDAVGVEPTASAEQIDARLDAMKAQFEDGAENALAVQRSQLENALRVLDRISQLLRTPTRRLAYDFTHGHLRLEERLAECAARGEEPNELRAVWHKVKSVNIEQLRAKITRAIDRSRAHDYREAITLAKSAIEDDPFNTVLREKIQRWEVLASVARECREGSLDADARLSWAQAHGVDAEVLRALWQAAQPARFKRARELGKRALQAESIKRYDEALTAAREALEHDPFNQQLRDTIAEWARHA